MAISFLHTAAPVHLNHSLLNPVMPNQTPLTVDDTSSGMVFGCATLLVCDKMSTGDSNRD